MVSCLIFKSLSHFEFIFMKGVCVCSDLVYWCEGVQLSQHHLLERLSFSHCIFLLPLLKIKCVGLFGALYSIVPYACFCANTMLF